MEKIEKNDAEWKAELTSEEYRVMRKKGTERAFTGEYDDFYELGGYRCAACGLPLFKSETKFHSGSGWPSFYAPADEEHIETRPDFSFFSVRTEVTCARCGAHLGHVFKDGPAPTGLRYCINSVALGFSPAALDESDEEGPAREED